MEAIILREFKFEGAPLPVYEVDGRPHWIAKQVGAALGYGKGGGELVTSISKNWKEAFVEGDEVLTLKGQKLQDFKQLTYVHGSLPSSRIPSLMLLSEKGLYKVLMLTRQPAGDRMRDWLAAEVLPQIARDGHFAPDRQVVDGKLESHSPKTQIQILLESVQQLALMEKRLEAIEDGKKEGTRRLTAVPEPEVPAGDVSMRTMIGRIVRAYCMEIGAGNDHSVYSKAWNVLYVEFRDLYRIDLARRAANRDIPILEAAEQMEEEGTPDVMKKLYAVAHRLFVKKKA